jgi:hypothetical protein
MFTEKAGAWVGLITSIITIGLTVHNTELSNRIQQRELDLKLQENILKQKTQELEVSKEKTSRYEFVNKLLPDILGENKNIVKVKTNLIILALTDDEAKRLFDGFSSSDSNELREIGQIGNDNISSNRDKLRAASIYEESGFQALIARDFLKAEQEFEAAEKVYPTYHQVYEIARLIRANKSTLKQIETQNKIFKTIVNELSYGASGQFIQQLSQLAP